MSSPDGRSWLRAAAGSLGLGRLKRAVLRQADGAGRARIALAPSASASPSRYLSIAAIFRNEARYLAEWLEFHRMVGVEHVYLYDNGSSDNPGAVLEPFVREGFATVIPWGLPWFTCNVDAQCVAYAHAIGSFGADWRWMAFIDIDEFLFPARSDNLAGLLKDYEDLPAVAGYWTMFGFGGHDRRPPGLVIEAYTMRAPFPTHAKPKSIVQPSQVVGVSNPHLFDLVEGPRRAYCAERKLRPKGEIGGDDILRLHHYFTKSREEFAERARPRSHPGKLADRYSAAEKVEALQVRDETILRFVPALKARLAAMPAGRHETV